MTNKKETLQFDAEVEKIFNIMIHSLYEDKEIFLRELVSNASDACDKLRYKAISNPELIGGNNDYKITIKADKKKRTLTISDNGIGMTRAELIKNLGTIARSGTQNFLKKLDEKEDTSLIGQFGVGFYASFMVAEKVTVISQAAGTKKAHIWESKGNQKFSIEEAQEETSRGTSVTLHLREEEEEYLDKFRIRHIIETHSNHVAFNISFVDENGEEEVLNSGKALWLKNKTDITEDEYSEFYRDIGHMGADKPWITLHNKAEGVVEYTNLLFIPSAKPFDLFHPDRRCQVKLYVKRVFIAEEGLDIIPSYLRFLRGIVDSEDLPLNISRQTVQNSAVMQKIRRSLTKKVLSELKKKSEKDTEAYKEFWENFGSVLKEGLCDGMELRDEIIEVCRFQTTQSEGKLTSLSEYSDRMKKDQEVIYYITGDSKSLNESPQLEGFRKNGIEVLLLTDSVDEFWVNVLYQYKGIDLKSVTRSGSDLSEKSSDEDNGADNTKTDIDGKSSDKLIAFIKIALGESVKDVRITNRLVESPVCLSVPEGAMDIRMERFMVDNKQLASVNTKILEINPEHQIIIKMSKDLENDDMKEQLTNTAHLLFAQANIAEGEPLEDVNDFTKRLNSILEKALAA